MSERVQIVITATNGTQQVFNVIAADSTKMGEAIQRSSQVANQAMQSVGSSATQTAETIQASSARSEASYKKIGNAIGGFGLAFGGLSLIASKANADAEASQARLSASIEATGASFDDYAVKIKGAADAGLQLGFDDEDLQNSISQLVQATGNVSKSITDMSLAEDIARGRGIALADAARIVGLAEQGRTGTLIRLGIQIDKNATKEEAIAALQGRYAGQAEAYSKTTAASWDRVKNSIENAAESAGSHLASVQLPIIALSSSAAALGPLIGSLKEIATAERQAAIAGAAADLALGPVGLAVGALAAGAGIYYLLTRTHEYTTAADIASGATQNLNNYFLQLASTLDPARAAEIKVFGDAFVAFVDAAASRSDDLAAISKIQSELAANATVGAPDYLTISRFTDGYDGLTQAQLRYIDSTYGVGQAQADGTVSLEEITAALVAYQANLAQLNGDQTMAVLSDVQKIFSQSTVDVDKATKGIKLWEDQLAAGILTPEQFTTNMDHAAASFDVFARDTDKSTAALATNTTAVATSTNAIAQQMAVYAAQNQSLGQSIDFNTKNAAATVASTAAIVSDTQARIANNDAIIGQMNTYAAQNQSLEAHNKIWVDMVTWANAWQAASDFSKSSSSLNLVSDAMGALDTTTKNAIPDTKEYSQYLDEQAQAAANAAKEVDNYRSKLGEVHMVVNDGANQFAKHATVAGNALDAGFRVAVGNTNAIASQSQGVEDWADKLIGVRGVYAEIDTLIAKGVIDSGEYARAQSAETSIFHNNAAIQRDILKIQTDQAPLLARLTKQERDYMDELAKQPAAQQLVTLGFMDQAESAKALAAQQLALSAASGELGKTGVATANKMIQAAAEADPVLKAMLVDMGLITVGSDGTITVHFGDVTESKDEMILLLDKIGDLITLLEQEFGIKVDHSDVDAAYSITESLNNQLDHLQGRQISYSVATVYTSTGGGGGAASGGTGGESVGGDPYVGPDPLGGGTGENPFGSATGARLGGVIGYARGGVVIEAAEAGAELMHFANGGTALARYRGLYNVPHGTYVDTAPATNAKLQRMGSGRPIIIEHMTVIANDSQQFADAMRAFEMSNTR